MEVIRYDVDQGLPQSMVNHVLQDPAGFIWLGTGDGLARFDGSRFVVYKHDPNDSTSIAHNSIWGIAQADEHHLHIGTRNGLDLLDTRTGLFAHLPTGSTKDPDGCWQPQWISKERALFYSPLSSETLTRTPTGIERRKTGHDPSYCIRTSNAGRHVHMLVVPDTLISMDTRNWTESVRIFPNPTKDRVLDMIRHDNSWLMLTEHGAWQWMDSGELLELPNEIGTLLRQEPGGKSIERDAHDDLWIGISGVGVALLRPDLSVRKVYRLLPEGERPLRITCIEFDHQGNTWVGTDGKGVFRIAQQRIKFGRAMPGQVNGWQPASWFTRDFAQWDAQRVVVSFHQGGLALFDERTQAFSPLIGGPLQRTGTYSQVLRDADGIIWMIDGTNLLALDPTTQRIVLSEVDALARRLLLDRAGRLLVLTPRGVQRYRLQSGSASKDEVPFDALEAWLDSARNVPTVALMDTRGRIWTSSPVAPVNVWSATVEHSRVQPFPVDVRMTHLFDNEDGTGWVSTNNGIYGIRWSDLRITRHLLPTDGLPDRFIYGMVNDGNGRRWISSNRGLTSASQQLDTVRNFSMADGLQSMEFNSSALFRSASGRLYFGGVNGFNHFVPAEVVDDPDQPTVALVRAWAQDRLLSLAGEAANIELPYPRNRLELEIAVLEMSSPEKTSFRYRMAGFQDEWRTASPHRPLVLERIPDGSFNLEVQGINGDGIVGPTKRLLSISVPLPFWVSTWFSVIAGCLLAAGIAALLFALYRRKKNAELLRVQQEMKELRMRTKLAKDIHDDVGSGLARMTALSRSSKRNVDADERFDKLGDISGELLVNLREVVWLNDPRNGSLDALLNRVRDHANDLFEDTSTKVTCDFPHTLSTQPIGGGCRRNLFLIAKEGVQNAYKYSRAENLVLRWRSDTNTFSFTIADDGQGIGSEVPQGSGHGSRNMRERAEEMNATYQRGPVPSGGTVITVSGPSSCLNE